MQTSNIPIVHAKSSALMLLISVGTLLGLGAISAKLAPMVGWQPLALLQWALLGGGSVQLISLFIRRIEINASGEVLRYALIAGVLVAVPNATAFAAVKHVGASLVALSFALSLVFTYGLSLILNLEVLKISRFAGIFLGLVGMVVFAISKVDPNGVLNPWVLVALSAPILVSIGNVFRTLYWPKNSHPAVLAAGMTLFGGLTLVCINGVFATPVMPAQWSGGAMALLLGQTFVFVVLYDLYFALQKAAGPVYLSQIGSVSAVVGVALAIILFGEIPTYWDAVAAGFVGIGVFLVNRKRE